MREIGKTEVGGVELPLYLGSDGRRYVKTVKGEFIALHGAKTFKTETSQNWPVAPEIRELADRLVHAVGPFPNLDKDEKEDLLAEFFDETFKITQERDKDLTQKKGKSDG